MVTASMGGDAEVRDAMVDVGCFAVVIQYARCSACKFVKLLDFSGFIPLRMKEVNFEHLFLLSM